jgi:hypothetical protein
MRKSLTKMAELDQYKKVQTDRQINDKIYLSKDVFEWLQANFVNAPGDKTTDSREACESQDTRS